MLRALWVLASCISLATVIGSYFVLPESVITQFDAHGAVEAVRSRGFCLGTGIFAWLAFNGLTLRRSSRATFESPYSWRRWPLPGFHRIWMASERGREMGFRRWRMAHTLGGLLLNLLICGTACITYSMNSAGDESTRFAVKAALGGAIVACLAFAFVALIPPQRLLTLGAPDSK